MKARGRRGIGLVSSTPLVFSLTLLACASDPQVTKTAEDARVRRETKIVLEQCPITAEGVVALDADLDKRAESFQVMAGERERCRVVDLNFDGKPDRTTYFDDQGRIRRVESDFDRDGRVDEISLFKDGKLEERHRASTLAGRLDTWEFYQESKIVRTERDENGDGIIDQWWEYERPECPMIHADTDGDGRPDPQSTIDYCKVTGYVPPPLPGEAKVASPDFTSPRGTVSEVSNVAAATGGSDSSGGANTSSGGAPSGTGGAGASSGGTAAASSGGAGAP